MAKEEYYCVHCGLFQWVDKSPLFMDWDNKMHQHVPVIDEKNHGCQNESCVTFGTPDDRLIYRVSSFGFAYFAKEHREEIKKIAWSSERFAPQSAIEHYRKQGMTIKF